LNFIGQLISKLSVSSASNRQSTLNWRITSCLIDCLTSIRQELDLFERVANEHGWMEDMGKATPSIQTRAYKDLFAGAVQPSASLLKGLVTLWATEKCYALSWGYANSNMPVLEDGNTDVMQTVFIPNWSSREFEQFVLTLGNLVDELARAADPVEIQETEDTWRQILWAEENFWPMVPAL
jgi:thiaminase